VGKDETAGRKKYEAPTVTPVTITSLSPKARGEVARLVSERAVEGQHGHRANGEFRIVLELDGRFRQVSEEFCGLVGYAREELLGKRIDAVTASRTVHIPQHLGAVVHFGQFHCLWMFVHREGHGILVRSDWELLPDLSMEVSGELLAV
jgi:PAS domain-containing protein